MVLPLYLAMTALEFRPIPCPAFLMLSPGDSVPPGDALPVLTDREPLDGHAIEALRRACQGREAVLLDFERPPTAEVRDWIRSLPCPAAAPPGYCEDGPVFLPPPPLHVTPEAYLAPWKGREVWLEAALLRQSVTVTSGGTVFSAPAPSGDCSGGFHSEELCCRFTQELFKDRAVFTIFDTPETLTEKLDRAAALGVTRAVGLYQELYGKLQFVCPKPSPGGKVARPSVARNQRVG